MRACLACPTCQHVGCLSEALRVGPVADAAERGTKAGLVQQHGRCAECHYVVSN